MQGILRLWYGFAFVIRRLSCAHLMLGFRPKAQKTPPSTDSYDIAAGSYGT
jgi:hypothetical protein